MIQVVTKETKVFALKRTSGSRSCVEAAVWAAVTFEISSFKIGGQIQGNPMRKSERAYLELFNVSLHSRCYQGLNERNPSV